MYLHLRFFSFHHTMQYKLVIIAAGGTGSRLNKNLPKQYMLLDDKPVLMHTINVFKNIADKIIIAIHPNMVDYWQELCQRYQFNTPHELVLGGDTRFQSVQNAVFYLRKTLTDNIFQQASLAVHDAARPLVDPLLIEKSFSLAQQNINCTLAVKSTNSIRIGTVKTSQSIDRNEVWQIQTPQTFPAKVLFEAYQQQENSLFTDDCSVVEKLGLAIQLIESSNKNIKLTFPEDFEIASLLLKK